MITQTRQELEALPLDELLMFWTNYIWMIAMRPMYHEMAVEGLTLPETVVLRNLQRGPLNVAEVADCIAITQSAASRAVDRLVRDGFVDRHENPDDRREKQLTLTQSGEALLARFQSIMARAVEPLTGALSAEEQGQLGALIVKVLSSPDLKAMAPNLSEHSALVAALT